MLSKPLLMTALSVAVLGGCAEVVENSGTPSTESGNVQYVAYQCPIEQSKSESQSQLDASFLIEYSDQDKVTLIEGKDSYSLIRVESASGEKYASADGLQAFWGHGESAMITFNQKTYKDCFIAK